MNKQLTPENGRQLIDALTRLTALEASEGSGTIIKADATGKVNKTAQAERDGLREYLKNGLVEHAGHLLGCWHAVRTEYEPLCNCMASILHRASAIQAQREAQTKALDETVKKA